MFRLLIASLGVFPLLAADGFPSTTLRRVVGADNLTALVSDTAGNVVAAGSTTSANLPVTNAAQARPGESQIMRTTDGGRTWQKMPVPASSGVTAIEPHPTNRTVLLAGTVDGVFRSSDSGETWRAAYPFPPTPAPVAGQAVYRIAFDPAQPKFVYALTNAGAIRSEDGGETWTKVETLAGGVLAFSPSSPWTRLVPARWR